MTQPGNCGSELNDRSVAESVAGGGREREVCTWIVRLGQNLCARLVFVLAQCTETICHCTSQSKTGNVLHCNVHLLKLLVPFDSVLPVT